MEFSLFEKKFKLVGKDLFSYYKRGGSKTEKWHLVKCNLNKGGYKRFSFKFKGKTKTLLYHRVVYYANNPEWNLLDSSKENVIDHVDGITTNNHISNLRNVSQHENQFNTKCKGYSFDKATGKYKAQITLNGKHIHIGCYDTPEEAHQAYLKKKEEVHIIRAR